MMLSCPQCHFVNALDATFCNRCGNHLQGVQDPLIDRIVNKYRIRERIGGGGFGSVYRAEHVELAHSFAIKILHPHLVHNELMVERFRREAQLLASLRHPNIVQVVDFGQVDGLGLYLVMEWLEGKTLQWHLKHEGCPPDDILKQMFEQLLDALSYAHQYGIVHRDLKPDNLIWIPGSKHRRTIKVLDFGIARMLEKQGRSRLTESGLAVGTPRYMSPEQAAGEIDRIDHRTDIYACGVLLMEVLTGKPIFTGTTNEILLHQMETPPPRLSDLAPEYRFPPALDWVLQRALAKNPAQRYDSAEAFANALFSVLDGEQTLIVRPEEVRSISAVRRAPMSGHGLMSGAGLYGGGEPQATPPPATPEPFVNIRAQSLSQPTAGLSGPALHQAGMASTRAITPLPSARSAMPLLPVTAAGQSGVYRGEKQSGQRTGQHTAQRSIPTQVAASNNWIWGVIGLLGGVGVALLFYIFGTLESTQPPPRPLRPHSAESLNNQSTLPTPPSLRDPDMSVGTGQKIESRSQGTEPRVTSPALRENATKQSDSSTSSATSGADRDRDRIVPAPRPIETPVVQTPSIDLPEVVEPRVRPRRVVRKRTRIPRKRRVKSRRVVRRVKSRRVPPRRVLPREVPKPRIVRKTSVMLTVRSHPAGASVWLDSVFRGMTPLTIAVSTGQTVQVRVKKQGYLGQNFSWKASANAVKRVTLAENIFR